MMTCDRPRIARCLFFFARTIIPKIAPAITPINAPPTRMSQVLSQARVAKLTERYPITTNSAIAMPVSTLAPMRGTARFTLSRRFSKSTSVSLKFPRLSMHRS